MTPPTSQPTHNEGGNSTARGGQEPIVFFDGDCALCNRWVRWFLNHDPKGTLAFAPLVGETARQLGIQLSQDPGQWALIYREGGQWYQGSTAVLRACIRMGGFWGSASGLLLVVPGSVRDGIYYSIARHRYSWFGRASRCLLAVPTEQCGRLLP